MWDESIVNHDRMSIHSSVAKFLLQHSLRVWKSLISHFSISYRVSRGFASHLIYSQYDLRCFANLSGGIIPSHEMHLLTLHNEDCRSDIALLYDYRASRKRDGVHAIDDLPYLRAFQIFHEVVVQYGSLDQFARPWNKRRNPLGISLPCAKEATFLISNTENNSLVWQLRYPEMRRERGIVEVKKDLTQLRHVV